MTREKQGGSWGKGPKSPRSPSDHALAARSANQRSRVVDLGTGLKNLRSRTSCQVAWSRWASGYYYYYTRLLVDPSTAPHQSWWFDILQFIIWPVRPSIEGIVVGIICTSSPDHTNIVVYYMYLGIRMCNMYLNRPIISSTGIVRQADAAADLSI